MYIKYQVIILLFYDSLLKMNIIMIEDLTGHKKININYPKYDFSIPQDFITPYKWSINILNNANLNCEYIINFILIIWKESYVWTNLNTSCGKYLVRVK